MHMCRLNRTYFELKKLNKVLLKSYSSLPVVDTIIHTPSVLKHVALAKKTTIYPPLAREKHHVDIRPSKNSIATAKPVAHSHYLVQVRAYVKCTTSLRPQICLRSNKHQRQWLSKRRRYFFLFTFCRCFHLHMLPGFCLLTHPAGVHPTELSSWEHIAAP